MKYRVTSSGLLAPAHPGIVAPVRAPWPITPSRTKRDDRKRWDEAKKRNSRKQPVLGYTTPLQSGTHGGSSTSLVTLGSNPTAGNLVVALVVSASSSATVTVADGDSNSYTATPNSPSTNSNAGAKSWVFYFLAISGTLTKAITATAAGVNPIDLWVTEWSGNASSSPLLIDAAHTGTATSSTPQDPTVDTTGTNGCLLVGCMGPSGAATGVGTPWTSLGLLSAENIAEYYVQTTGGSQAVSFTQNAVKQWSAMIAAFKPAASSGSFQHQGLDLNGLNVGGPFFGNPIG